ncbi:MAG: hypothetical protein ABI999_11685 [Acidobacteriota bacterium]
MSRYNDIDGYWGLGVLRLFADEYNVKTITLDLLDIPSKLSVDSPLSFVEEKYRQWLLKTLEKLALRMDDLAEARIELRFSTFEEFPKTIRDTRGEPYLCIVTLTRTTGKTFSAARIGVCAPHDPRKDRQSNRASGPV